MNFKQNDTKALRSKSLLNEIESVYDEVRPLGRGLALWAYLLDRRAVPARLGLTQEGALPSAEGRLLSSPPPRWTFLQVTGRQLSFAAARRGPRTVRAFGRSVPSNPYLQALLYSTVTVPVLAVGKLRCRSPWPGPAAADEGATCRQRTAVLVHCPALVWSTSRGPSGPGPGLKELGFEQCLRGEFLAGA